MHTIVIGHKNPDMDSICSAVAYAHLKQVTGTPNVIAARAGNTNERIDFVLHKFRVEPPVFISDLSDRVSDVMERDVICVHADSTAYDAIHLLEKRRLRGLPVVDGERRFLGLLSAFKISHHLFRPREGAERARLVTAGVQPGMRWCRRLSLARGARPRLRQNIFASRPLPLRKEQNSHSCRRVARRGNDYGTMVRVRSFPSPPE